MERGDLTHGEWIRLKPHLPVSGRRGGRWSDHRRVIYGILFRVRTGIPWRDLPERFGSWKTVSERHRSWSADGTWDRVLRAVQADADLADRIDWSMASVDPTSCRAHQHAAGARKKKCRRLPRHRSGRGDTALAWALTIKFRAQHGHHRTWFGS
nr:IS5 family transposase [Streptomyces anulatus]